MMKTFLSIRLTVIAGATFATTVIAVVQYVNHKRPSPTPRYIARECINLNADPNP